MIMNHDRFNEDDLSEAEQNQLEEQYDKFAAAWQNYEPGSKPPDIREFLFAGGSENYRGCELHRLILHDLMMHGRLRLTSGKCRTTALAEMISDWPLLVSDQEAISFYGSEYCYRVKWTPADSNPPAVEDFLCNVPDRLRPGVSAFLWQDRFIRFADRETRLGGIGKISPAWDLVLGRTAAWKQLKPDCRRAWESFQREADITARLDHPGVVPIYGKSQPDSNRTDEPWFTMRYLENYESLRDRINAVTVDDRKQLTTGQIRELLDHFVSACNTIEYAHQRGVVHLDLKPENIMLGHFGETVVIDWGAAVIDDREVRTRDRQFTPAYQSPEHNLGKKVDRRSDIYSLGIILTQILTGSRDARTPEDAAPLPPLLKKICRKATAEQPESRYTSARWLADDLTAWLTDTKIEQKEGDSGGDHLNRVQRTVREKLSMTVRNHPRVTSVIVAATVFMACGAVVFGYFQNDNRVVQEDLRIKAEDSFGIAKETVNTLLLEIANEDLLDQPGMQPLRRKLLEHGQRYFEKFVAMRKDDASLRRELADAYVDLATVNLELGESKDAVQHLTAAESILLEEQLSDRDNIDILRNLVRCRQRLGTTLADYSQDSDRNPVQLLQSAIATSEQILNLPMSDLNDQFGLARSLQDLGMLQESNGSHVEEALLTLNRAKDLYQHLTELESTSRFWAGRAGVEITLGNAYLTSGKLEQATTAFTTAVSLAEQICEKDPGISHQIRLLATQISLAGVLRTRRRFAELRAVLDKAIGFGEAAAAMNPGDVRIRSHVATLYALSMVDHLQSGQGSLALTMGEKAVAEFRRLKAGNPDNREVRENFFKTLTTLADILPADDHEAAVALAKEAISEIKQLQIDFPEIGEYAVLEAKSQIVLALFKRTRGNYAECVSDLRQTIEKLQSLPESTRTTGEWSDAMVDATKQLAGIYRATIGKRKEEQEQLTRLESLLKSYDQSLFPDKQRELATTYLRLGGNIQGVDCAGAHQYYQKGIGILDELVEKYGLETDKRDLANAWSSHASLHSQCGDEDTAIGLLEKSIHITAALIETNPSNPDNKIAASIAFSTLAMVRANQGKTEEAIRLERQSIEMRRNVHEMYPESEDSNNALAGACIDLGSKLRTMGQHKASLETLTEGIRVLVNFSNRMPDNETARQFLRNGYWSRAETYTALNDADSALQDWDQCLKLSPASNPDPFFALRRCRSLLLLQGFRAAKDELQSLLNEESLSLQILLEQASLSAVAASVAAEDKDIPIEERDEVVTIMKNSALSKLTRVKTEEKFDRQLYHHISNNSDFDCVAESDQFKDLIQNLVTPAP